MRRYLIAALLLAATAAAAYAAPGPEPDLVPGESPDPIAGLEREIPVSADFPSLLGVERELAFDVRSRHTPDGKRWIRLCGEYDSVYRASIDDVIAALWDFEGSPKTFSRIMATRVRSDDGTVAVIEQRTGVRVLGFSYLSNLVFRDLLSRDGPKSATLEFEAIEVDETTLSSRGSWTLVESDDESGPLTYVRYFLDSYVKPKYPAQEWIMRQFGGGDMRRVIRELYKATKKISHAG
jgi:hypothetical protein